MLAVAIACGSDTAVIDSGGTAGSTASGSGNAGSSAAVGAGNAAAGAGNAAASSAGGAANVGGSSGGDAGNAAGTGGDPVASVPPGDGGDPLGKCDPGSPSDPCDWSVPTEFAGAKCTPSEVLQIGCCACGADSILRVCDGNMSCSNPTALGFSDDACGRGCPLVEFSCPDSGVFSAMTGSFPDFDENGVAVSRGVPSACHPVLVNVSNDGASGSDAGVIGFDPVHQVLVNDCARCHANGGLQALLDLPQFASSDVEVAFEAAQSYAPFILNQITSGAMPPDSCTGRPPGSDGCVSADDVQLIRKWVIAGTPR